MNLNALYLYHKYTHTTYTLTNKYESTRREQEPALSVHSLPCGELCLSCITAHYDWPKISCTEQSIGKK